MLKSFYQVYKMKRKLAKNENDRQIFLCVSRSLKIPFCSLSFVLVDTLISHSRTHTDARVYKKGGLGKFTKQTIAVTERERKIIYKKSSMWNFAHYVIIFLLLYFRLASTFLSFSKLFKGGSSKAYTNDRRHCSIFRNRYLISLLWHVFLYKPFFLRRLDNIIRFFAVSFAFCSRRCTNPTTLHRIITDP